MKQKTKEKAKILQQPKKGGKALQKNRSITQAGLEYLLTYGWALVLVVTIIGVFVLVFNPSSARTERHSFSQNFLIDGFEVSGSDSALMPNKFALILRPKTPVTIESYEISSNGVACTGTVVGQKFGVGRFERFIISGDINLDCAKTIGQYFQFNDSIGFIDQFGMQRNENGQITGFFSSVSQGYESTAWERSAFSPNPLKNENGAKIGSFNGTCPAVVPNPGEINFIPAAAYETWSLPVGCDTGCSHGGCTNGGFGNTHCKKNASKLAHGWYHARLKMSPFFGDKKLYLVGNASFNPPGGGSERVTNGICINDNFYFYVNGQLLSMGGTTGQQNKEVIRHCDGCSESDGWCIWPVELTASGQFKIGEWNDIYVLVEDYCDGGGLNVFRFFMA